MSGVNAMAPFEALQWVRRPACIQVTMTRPGRPNRLDETLLRELGLILEQSEQDPECRMVVLRGNAEAFCLGMDFADVTQKMVSSNAAELTERAALFMQTLRRISEHSRVVVCVVEGRALGGGAGLVAACDFAVAVERAEFGLPELLWGLLPANILPFLVRRMGYQKAYRFALTTQNISAAEALQTGLVDAVSAEPDEYIRRLLLRLARVEPETILDLKKYMRRMWVLDDAMEQAAIDEFARLVALPRVQNKLRELASLAAPSGGRAAR